MRYYLFIIILFFTITGCHQKQPVDGILLQVEEHLDKQPEVSLELLYGIEKDKTVWRTKRDSAYYNLLYIETIHRLGLSTSSDSLINIAERYYDSHGNRTERARIYLNKGIIYHHRKEYTQAVLYMKQAEEQASNIIDSSLQYAIEERLGLLNEDEECYQLALSYYKKALNHTDSITHLDRRTTALCHIADIYKALGQVDSFNYYITQCIPVMDGFRNYTIEEKRARGAVLTVLGEFYLKNGNREKAKQLLDNALVYGYGHRTSKVMGDYYESIGDMENAARYWYDGLQTIYLTASIEAHQKLITYYKSQGNHKAAFNISEQLNIIYQDNHRVKDPTKFMRIQDDYDHELAKRHLHQRIVFIAGIASLLSLIIILFWYYHKHIIGQMNHSYTKRIEKYTTTQTELDKILHADIVLKLHHKATIGQQAAPDDWQQLNLLMLRYAPVFMNFLGENKELNARDMHVSILSRLRFIPSEIAILTNTSAQTITNTRVSLLRKLFGERGGARVFDKRIKEF
ncbi:MAG: hypothetical protein IJV27_02130 [Prevotella sp.]|nr:hypothetical protein [Prevotella sp.]